MFENCPISFLIFSFHFVSKFFAIDEENFVSGLSVSLEVLGISVFYNGMLRILSGHKVMDRALMRCSFDSLIELAITGSSSTRHEGLLSQNN